MEKKLSSNFSKISNQVNHLPSLIKNSNSNKNIINKNNILTYNNKIPFNFLKRNRSISISNFSEFQSPRNNSNSFGIKSYSTSIGYNNNSDNNSNTSFSPKQNFSKIISPRLKEKVSNLKLTKLKTFNKNLIYKNDRFSPVNQQSKKENNTVQEIYKYYIKKNKREEKLNKLINKLGDKNISPQKYTIINEIRKNNEIAFKNDFKIQDYQKTLLKLLNKKISKENLEKLKKNYKIFNKNNFGISLPTGRFINFANKLKGRISTVVFYKLIHFDKNYSIFLQKKEDNNKNKKDSLLEEYNKIIENYDKKKLCIKKYKSNKGVC